MKQVIYVIAFALFISAGCSKGGGTEPLPKVFKIETVTVNGVSGGSFNVFLGTSIKPSVKISFTEAVDHATVSAGISFQDKLFAAVPTTITYENYDRTVVATPSQNLVQLSSYTVAVSNTVKSASGNLINQGSFISIGTGQDTSVKFPLITDNELLDKIQRTTFKYFWDFAHPTSGLARERNSSGDIVTTGGSGFGIMAIVTAIDRGFISKAEGLTRMKTIVDFLLTKAEKFHGAFPHWMNGSNGSVVPFSTKDNGADLVETSFLVEGLLCARQYFNGSNTDETTLRADINKIWQGVEWDWFRKSNENVLYWHWSPNYSWDMNMPIKGWNECLVTYALAASSPTHSIPKSVYDNGWASNGSMKNGNTYYGVQLPLGPAAGGPLFFAHYSFMGINPKDLTDTYADYWVQNRNHTLINYNYAVADPNHNGYSSNIWGLTASDIKNSYNASSPTNDVGVIAPTAAISSLPYTPVESMKALKYFYYVLGDVIWKENGFGFVDAFSIRESWFADSYLAIDQGPIIVMIENYRSGLLWKLFMSCPEVKTGMKALGFSSPNL
jgi:hypothetical protein